MEERLSRQALLKVVKILVQLPKDLLLKGFQTFGLLEASLRLLSDLWETFLSGSRGTASACDSPGAMWPLGKIHLSGSCLARTRRTRGGARSLRKTMASTCGMSSMSVVVGSGVKF